LIRKKDNDMNQSQVSRVAWYSTALAILTTIHHVYGAVIYHTPWRLHILLMSIPVIVLTLILERQLRKNDSRGRLVMFWILYFITLIPSLGLIGVFEGIYNHLFKNILFFGGAGVGLLQRLFPAPTYEMPNDFIFEFTGVMQGVIAIVLIRHMFSLTISRLNFRQPV
jgi:hypothetical protein